MPVSLPGRQQSFKVDSFGTFRFTAFGLIQAYGARQSIAAAVGSTAVSYSAQGLVLGPVAAKASAQSNGTTFALGPIVLIQNDVSGSGFFAGLIRAL